MWDGAEHRDPVTEHMGRNVSLEARSGGHVARPVTSDGQPPGQVGNHSDCRDQQIVSFVWHHRSDRERPNNGLVAATGRRHGIITWSQTLMRCDGTL
jgi:hypothetical protein